MSDRTSDMEQWRRQQYDAVDMVLSSDIVLLGTVQIVCVCTQCILNLCSETCTNTLPYAPYFKDK